MQKDIGAFNESEASIVVVGKHTTEEMAKYWKENSLPYAGIPDPEAKLAKTYQQQWKALKLGLMPALFVIGKDGKIAYLHYSTSMADIPENSTVIGELQKLKE